MGRNQGLMLPPALLEALSGGQPQRELSKEEKQKAAREALGKKVDHLLSEECEQHADMERHGAAFLRTIYNVDLLPSRVNDVIVKALIHQAMNDAEDADSFLKGLGDTNRIAFAMFLAAGVMRTLGHELFDEALNGPVDPDREERQARGGQRYL